MKPHLEINKKLPFKNEHFDTWVTHFTTSIDYYFNGKKSSIAKSSINIHNNANKNAPLILKHFLGIF